MPLVLTHKSSSGYDDVPEERYHFPETYRPLVQRSEGELFAYYEPRREGGREVYVAMARLGAMRADPKLAGHFYVQVHDYRQFTNAVQWKLEGRSLERGLQKADGSTNKGRFGRAVRELELEDFQEIVRLGFAKALLPERETYPERELPLPMVADPAALVERRVVEVVMQKKVRDRAFMLNVREAYDQTCAFTGLRIVNGGGWTEMEAAHIRPVEKDGPDSVRNGLALSRTMHALFDRGFLTLSADLKIVASKHLPDQVRAMLPKDRLAHVPKESHLRPHPVFLEFHRDTIFKDRAA